MSISHTLPEPLLSFFFCSRERLVPENKRSGPKEHNHGLEEDSEEARNPTANSHSDHTASGSPASDGSTSQSQHGTSETTDESAPVQSGGLEDFSYDSTFSPEEIATVS